MVMSKHTHPSLANNVIFFELKLLESVILHGSLLRMSGKRNKSKEMSHHKSRSSKLRKMLRFQLFNNLTI